MSAVMTAAATGSCGSCALYDPTGKLCRAHPPLVNPNSSQLWPTVDPVKDWCGEFQKMTGPAAPTPPAVT